MKKETFPWIKSAVIAVAVAMLIATIIVVSIAGAIYLLGVIMGGVVSAAIVWCLMRKA